MLGVGFWCFGGWGFEVVMLSGIWGFYGRGGGWLGVGGCLGVLWVFFCVLMCFLMFCWVMVICGRGFIYKFFLCLFLFIFMS